MAELQMTAIEPAFATGHWNELFIGVWRGAPTVPLVYEWTRQYDDMAARSPRGFAILCLIEAQTSPPSAAVRRTISDEIERIGAPIRAMATVAEAGGFAGAVIRSVVLALSNATSSRLDRRMFNSCGEASRWLLPHLSGVSDRFITSREIESVVGTFRASLGPRRAAMRATDSALPLTRPPA